MSTDLESDELTEHYHKIAEYDGDKVPPPFLTWTAGCKTDLDRIREQLRALQQQFDLERERSQGMPAYQHGCPICGWPYNHVPPWWYRYPYYPYRPYEPVWVITTTSDTVPATTTPWCGSVGVPHV